MNLRNREPPLYMKTLLAGFSGQSFMKHLVSKAEASNGSKISKRKTVMLLGNQLLFFPP